MAPSLSFFVYFQGHSFRLNHTSPSAEAVFVGKFCTLIKLLSHEVDYLDDEKKLGRHVEQVNLARNWGVCVG